MAAYRGRVEEPSARERFARARVGRLATVTPSGKPHLVPVVFAVIGQTVWSGLDAKANPSVSLLVDEYDEDWRRLWWVRADGTAEVVVDPTEQGLAALIAKYPQYHHQAPLTGPFIRVRVERWRFWSAT
jgi:nitroimidazol reductase NimA-like FMN-containing flavoprotein (pyridoxamine 5'-phosphate oxidase superfamily)